MRENKCFLGIGGESLSSFRIFDSIKKKKLWEKERYRKQMTILHTKRPETEQHEKSRSIGQKSLESLRYKRSKNFKIVEWVHRKTQENKTIGGHLSLTTPNESKEVFFDQRR